MKTDHLLKNGWGPVGSHGSWRHPVYGTMSTHSAVRCQNQVDRGMLEVRRCSACNCKFTALPMFKRTECQYCVSRRRSVRSRKRYETTFSASFGCTEEMKAYLQAQPIIMADYFRNLVQQDMDRNTKRKEGFNEP